MTKETRALGAQISHMLWDRGVDTVFGIPGVHNQEMYRGLEEAGVRHILARHEQGAGFMADGYARASGRPGVAYVITGPGLLNTGTAMGQAYSDSVPLLVLSSCLDKTAKKAGQLHQMRDQEAAGAAICEWSLEARSPQEAYGLIDRALCEFEATRPRPKHIQVPIGFLEGQAAPPKAAPPRPKRPVAGDDQIAAAVKLLMAAKRPLFVLGGGGVAGAEDIAQLVDRVGGAVFTSYAGRGILPPEHSMLFGATLARPESARVFASADLVVVLGSELAEVDLWREKLGHDCPMLRVDLDPVNLVGDGQTDLMVQSDVAGFLSRLLAALPNSGQSGWSTAEIAAFRKNVRAELEAERQGIPRVVDALRAATPAGTMIFSDMTQFAYVAKEIWDMDAPGHWHHPTGFGTLGYALPAAIGGAVARPGLPTMAIAGDYGFQYTLPELGTAAELGQCLPIILWDNGKLKEIEDSMIGAQIAPNAVIARNPDFGLLAEAYGCAYDTPVDLAAMREAVTRAFAHQGPSLIHIRDTIA